MWTRSGLALVLLVLALLSLTGCFEDPVQQGLELRFRADGAAELRATVRIASTDEQVHERTVRDRAEAVRERLAEDGLDWPARLDRLESERRSDCSERVRGQLRERRFGALVADPGRLGELLPDGLVRLGYSRDEEGLAELVVLVEPGTRANRRQRDLLLVHEERVAEAYLAYLRAAEELASDLEERPERARVVLWHVLRGADSVFEPFGGAERVGALDEQDEGLVESLTEAMDRVVEAFGEVPDGEQHLVDALSRLVHDPFAFDLNVRLPVAPLEVEGFLVQEEGRRLEAPRHSLASALATVSEQWIQPDWLVLLWQGPWREGGAKLDLDELASRPRRVEPPPSFEALRVALAEALRPPDLLRVRWRAPAPPEGALDWEEGPQR